VTPGAHKAVLKGYLYLPLAAIGDDRQVTALKQTLTFKPVKLAADHHPKPVELFDVSVDGWLGVPRAWGRQRYERMPMIDRMSDGQPILTATKRPSPNHPSVLNPAAQAKFMADLQTAVTEHDEVQAIAATGSGKTVCALNTAANHGRTTFIIVPWEHLAHQWADEIHLHLGVPRERIGFVQGPKCQFRDVDFAIGIFNSSAQRAYPKEFYTAFGMVIVDEAHKVGTEYFSPALAVMAARKRLTLTATAERKDGGHHVIEMHTGPIRVESDADALPGDVYVDNYDCGNYRLWGGDAKQRVACLARDVRRNQRMVGHIIRAYERGRQMMIVSYSVDHLETLMDMCRQRGLSGDIETMGLFTGEKTVMINGKPHMVRDSSGKMKAKRKKVSRHELEEVKAKSQLFFTTYGKFKEGGDVPRLDCGMDATPQSEATQVIGRIRRPQPGKKRPLWVTIRDVNCERSLRWFDSRCRDYRSTGMEIIGQWQGNA
jgi:superfamily II DNA or RNA helicase